LDFGTGAVMDQDKQENVGPTAFSPSDDAILERAAVIIEEIRPFIQSDGGDIELLKVEDQIVYVRLTGACIGCPSSMITLKHGVEARIREEIPEVESVEMV
jgi:Fe-S cluster biogenesis protein NfuA